MNPYREIRLDSSLTQKDLAQSLQITPQVILRTEQGLFSSPPSSLTQAMSDLSGLSPEQLTQQYYSWVFQERQLNGSHYKVQQAISSLRYAPTNVPWRAFRVNYLLCDSVASFAKLIVVQISIVQEFEKLGRNLDQIESILLSWKVPTGKLIWPADKKALANA